MQCLMKVRVSKMCSMRAEWTSWLIQRWKGTLRRYLRMGRQAVVRLTLWLERKSDLELKGGREMIQTGLFLELLSICGSRWLWGLNSFMLKLRTLRYTRNSCKTCLILEVGFFILGGMCRMDFLLKIWQWLNALQRTTWLLFWMKESKIEKLEAINLILTHQGLTQY